MVKKFLLTAFVASLPLLPALAAGPVKIAFVDTGNTGRSVTAEALANARIAEKKLDILVISRAADLNPYNIVPEPFAATLLKQHGMDVSTHRAAQLDGNDVRHSDLILTMTAKHKAAIIAQYPAAASKTFTLAEYATGQQAEIVDAWQQPMAVYEQTFKQIDEYVPLALNKAVAK